MDIGQSSASDAVLLEPLRTIVVKPHHTADESQLELRVNDIVYVLEQDETGWWGGHKEGEELTGWFPGACVRPLEAAPAEDRPLTARRNSQEADNDSCRLPPSPTRGVQGGSGASPPETSTRSPLRHSLVAASPQRGRSGLAGSSEGVALGSSRGAAEADGLGAETSAAWSSGPSAGGTVAAAFENPRVETLVSENARLKKEKEELDAALKRLQRQSNVDRRNLEKLEVEKQQEKMRREQLEQELTVESSERTSLSAEVSHLRADVEKERRNSQAYREENQQLQIQFEHRFAQVEEELRQTQETSRKSLSSERQRAKQLEEQLRSCQEEVVSVRREQRASISTLTAAGTSDGRAAHEESIVVDVPVPATSRLTNGLAGEPPAKAMPAQASDAPSAASSKPAPTWGPHSAANDHWRQPEPQRTAQTPYFAPSAPAGHSSSTSGQRAASPGWLGKAHSTGDLTPTRQGRAPSSPTQRKDAEKPRPGCVAEKVSVFESRCRSQTPRGMRNITETRAPPAYVYTLPRERHTPVATVGSRTNSAGMIPPALPRSTPTLAPPRGPGGFGVSMLPPPEDLEAASDEQLVFGMSPICKSAATQNFA